MSNDLDPPEALSITAIMPAFNAASTLRQTLPPLIDLLRRGVLQAVILVDDGSDDDTRSIAHELGSLVLSSGGRCLGPGQARNVGARATTSDALWFVDADVIVHEDGADRIRYALAEPGVVATFGSYDDSPPAPGLISQYKNLVHHHYHQIGRRGAATFWAGCGAVRRDAFLAAGGFDVVKYPKPSIEDIELGYRLRARGGRITLLHELQGTHLKRWTLRSLIETDIGRRALPWSRLLLSGVLPRDDLNIGLAEQLRAIVACLIVATFFAFVGGWLRWPVLAGALAVAAAANLDLLVRLSRRNGWSFGLFAILLHQIYYLYSLASYGWCWFERLARPKRSRPTKR